MASDPMPLIMGMLQGAGMGRTVGDFAQQNATTQNILQSNQLGALQLQKAKEAQARDASYQAAVSAYQSNPTPDGPLRLATMFPEHATPLIDSYKLLSAEKRAADLNLHSQLYNAASNNRGDLVHTLLTQIQGAEEAQGIPHPEIDDALTALAAKDPNIMRSIQGFSQLHAAALDPDRYAANLAATGKLTEGFTLGKSRYDANGRLMAREPEYRTVGPDQHLVEVGLPEGGNQPDTGASAPSYDMPGGNAPVAAPTAAPSLVSRMLPATLASEAGGTLANPRTSPKGAVGPMQVMPGTNADPGYGVRPAQDDSQAERARVGRDYLAAMVERYKEPAKAWAAYNAGPGAVDAAVRSNPRNWLKQLPSETRRYVAKNMASLVRGGGSAAPDGGDGGTVTGPGVREVYAAPSRPGYRALTPQEIATTPGLDPARAYQVSPQGRVAPIGAAPRASGGGSAGGAKPAKAPRTTDNVIAAILNKVAAGESLTPGEQEIYREHRAKANKYDTSGGLPRPRTAAEAAKLPSGTSFMTPDGRIKVRP